MPLIEQHPGRRPESCEVCRYLETHPYIDRLLTHTLTMFAGAILIEDLEETGSLSFRGTYTELFAGAAPGRPVEFQPEHWALALLAAPEIKLSLETPREGL